MKTKRFLTILALLLVVMVLALCFVACDEGSNPDNTETETTNTPTNDDNQTGNDNNQTGNDNGESDNNGGNNSSDHNDGNEEHVHSEVIDPAVAPTCTTTGLTEGKHCSVCNTVIVAQSTIQSSGHQYNNGVIVTQATCNQSGTKKFTCTKSTCGHSYTELYELLSYTATELYNQSVKYVGEIVTYDKSGSELALGTGFVISSDGKIVTNYHVIEGAYSAKITINNTQYNIASVLAYDSNIDLAVLKINASGLTAANICKLPVSTGATVYAIGSSKGLTNTFSQGMITQAERVMDGVVYIQHSSPISSGNSGGPLLNIYGEVIGINTMTRIDAQNINMAVFTAELDNLVYGTPMTLAELYEQNNAAFDKLVDYIITNGEQNGDRIEYLFRENASEITTFDYYVEDGVIFLNTMVFSSSGDDSSFYVAIVLEEDASQYWYTARRNVNGQLKNKMTGYIQYETFNQSTLVGYYSYEGLTSQESIMREDASEFAIYLIEVLEWLCTNYLGLTVADFGFVAF